MFLEIKPVAINSGKRHCFCITSWTETEIYIVSPAQLFSSVRTDPSPKKKNNPKNQEQGNKYDFIYLFLET